MKLVKFEILKIITNKLFMVTFFILCFLNLLFLSYQNYLAQKNDIPYEAYKILSSDLKDKTHEEKGKYIKDAYERAEAINMIYYIQNNAKNENLALREIINTMREENKELYQKYYEESKNPTWKYTGNSDTELLFLKQINNDYNIINNYQYSLNAILEVADNLKNISIFKSKDEISFNNITKTASEYNKMQNIKINYENGKYIEKISSVNITDFIVLVLVFLLSAILITEEKEKNLFILIKSTKKGKRNTIIAKILTLFICVFLICLIFYGTNFIYYSITIGFGNIFMTIQSTSTLLLSTFKINILEYLILFFSVKCLYMFLFSFIIFYLALKFYHSSEVLIGLFLLTLFNLLIYKNIDITSKINLFQSFNLLNLMNTFELFRIYDNLRFYSFLLPKTSILIILQVVTIILLILFSFSKYIKQMKHIERENVIWRKIKSMKFIKSLKFNHIFSFEIYKLMFVNKGLIIIILFSLFIGFHFKNQNFNLSYQETFYKNYMDILSGNLNLEKEKLIKNTIKEYEKAEEELFNIQEKVLALELSNVEAMLASQPYEDILATRGVFARIESKYDYIRSHPGSAFVYDTGYYKLFRISQSNYEYDIYLIIVTIISILGIFIMEYKTGFIRILNATKNGRIKTARNKVIATILICTIIYMISIIPEIISVYKMYGLDNINMSITSLEIFHNLPSYISILSYFIAFYIVKYISYILIVLIVLYISLKLKNIVFVFITSLFIFLMPFVLVALKIVQYQVFPLMNLSIIRINFIYLLLIPIIVMMIIFLYNSVVKGLE